MFLCFWGIMVFLPSYLWILDLEKHYAYDYKVIFKLKKFLFYLLYTNHSLIIIINHKVMPTKRIHHGGGGVCYLVMVTSQWYPHWTLNPYSVSTILISHSRNPKLTLDIKEVRKHTRTIQTTMKTHWNHWSWLLKTCTCQSVFVSVDEVVSAIRDNRWRNTPGLFLLRTSSSPLKWAMGIKQNVIIINFSLFPLFLTRRGEAPIDLYSDS